MGGDNGNRIEVERLSSKEGRSRNGRDNAALLWQPATAVGSANGYRIRVEHLSSDGNRSRNGWNNPAVSWQTVAGVVTLP